MTSYRPHYFTAYVTSNYDLLPPTITTSTLAPKSELKNPQKMEIQKGALNCKKANKIGPPQAMAGNL
jgi:hypothetical protein